MGDIVDDDRDRPATPMRLGLRTQSPLSSGGAWASAALALLDDGPASPASRRLASAHAALGTRHILILGQAPRIMDKSAGHSRQGSQIPGQGVIFPGSSSVPLFPAGFGSVGQY